MNDALRQAMCSPLHRSIDVGHGGCGVSIARAQKTIGGAPPFLLVTSAYHMPRAMRQMRRAGARAFPAPAEQLVNPAPGIDWRKLLPNSAGLGKTKRAFHEYLGLLAMAVGIN
jgi:uncharacterized SAM-binding protein YcdF (DUF218 family)